MTFEIEKDSSGLMTKEIILHTCNDTDAFHIVHWKYFHYSVGIATLYIVVIHACTNYGTRMYL